MFRTSAIRFSALTVAGICLVACGPKEEKPVDSMTGQPTVAEPAANKPAPPATGVKELVKKDTKPGAGKDAVAKGDRVWVLYQGTLMDGTEFDSNMAPDKDPFSFSVGNGQVIEGWDEGLIGMKRGGERELTIPAAMAYGEAGSPPKIPANADLKFKVKVLEILKPGDENNFWKEPIKAGSGAPAAKGDTVVVHYTGTLSNGKKFDSSRDRNEPFEVTLGQGRVIKGWDFGIVGMRKGERTKLYIPPAIGYGEAGSPPAIGPNQLLIFDIEVLDIKRG